MTARTLLPASIRALLEAHHAGGVSEADCLRCRAACCLEPGFAILENLIAIHRHYRRAGLERAAFRFEPGLSLADFAFRYFDLTTYRSGGRRGPSLLLFHPRARSADGELVAIPELGDFWEVRAQLFAQNPWLSRGCCFLDGRAARVDAARGAHRRCLLHERSSASRLGRKPIDCVFFTCERRLVPRFPDEELTSRWLRALALAYPGSLERFQELAGTAPAG